MEWQPIETAPEGKNVLVAHYGVVLMIARREGSWWIRDSDDCPRGYPIESCKPTHWMPLPSLPQKRSKREALRLQAQPEG